MMGTQEKNVNAEFEVAYLALENYLRNITNFPTWVSVIKLYEQTLSPEHRAEIETFRHFRNNNVGHKNVTIGVATANERWVEALRYELEEVKKNEKTVVKELKKLYDKQNSHSLPFALETIFKNRKSDEEVTDHFKLYSKLNDYKFTYKNKEKLDRYFKVDSQLHLFESIMKEGKDLRPLYSELKDANDVSEQEFNEFITLVEGIVSTEREITESEQPAVTIQEDEAVSNNSANESKQPEDEKTDTDILSAIFEKENPLKTDKAYLYVKALKFISKGNTVSVTALQKDLAVGYVLMGEIVDWLIAQGFISKEAKRGVGRFVLKSKSTIYKFIKENVDEEVLKAIPKKQTATLKKSEEGATQTPTINYSYSSGVDIDTIFLIAAITALISVIALPILASVFHWSWTFWQWYIGIVGGLGLSVIFALIVDWLDDEVIIDNYVLGPFVLGACIVINFILLLIFKSNYGIIFGCFSVLEILVGVIFSILLYDAVEEEAAGFVVIEIIIALILFIVKLIWL